MEEEDEEEEEDFLEGKETRQRFFSTFSTARGRPPLPFKEISLSFAEKSLTCLENSRTRYEPGVQTGSTRSSVPPASAAFPGSTSIVIS